MHKFGLAVPKADGLFMTSVDAQTTAGALFFIIRILQRSIFSLRGSRVTAEIGPGARRGTCRRDHCRCLQPWPEYDVVSRILTPEPGDAPTARPPEVFSGGLAVTLKQIRAAYLPKVSILRLNSSEMASTPFKSCSASPISREVSSATLPTDSIFPVIPTLISD